MILSLNSEYYLNQRQLIEVCNGEMWCFLCGTDRIRKYLDELRLQRVNTSMGGGRS
jgi:NADH:ubiquinone oxidoreductase subunit E